GERGERDLDGGDEITVSLENRDDPAPAACVGERAVNQHHGLLRNLLCRRNRRKNHQDEEESEHVRSSLRRSRPNDSDCESLVRLRRGTLQSVHRAGLGGPEGDPIAGGVLKCQEERLAAPQGFLLELLAALELDLKGELADERSVVAADAPERDVR